MAATEDALGELHAALAEVLTNLVRGEAVSASHLAVAAKFLKDNNITCDPGTSDALDGLRAALEKRKGVKPALTKKEQDELSDITGLMH